MIPDPSAGSSLSSDAGVEGPRLLVGLGNPGEGYSGTRHNVGFAVLDLLATRLGAAPGWLKAGGQRCGRFWQDRNRGIAMLWPHTFMNLSGAAVNAARRQLECVPAAIFVITDDFNLDLGALRIRPGGSHGGHNGLRSIEAALETPDYPRLRIGVGDPGTDSVDYVLNRFRRPEQKLVDETLETASWAAEDWVMGKPLDELQARFNRRMP